MLRQAEVLHGREVVAALKPDTASLNAQTRLCSPRPRGRGRIEARPPSPSWPLVGRVLHGREVVAALKPAALLRVDREVDRSPRPRGRGRIEALRARRDARQPVAFST